MPISHQPTATDDFNTAVFASNVEITSSDLDPADPSLWAAAPVTTYSTAVNTITADPARIHTAVTILKPGPKDSDNTAGLYNTHTPFSTPSQSDGQPESCLSPATFSHNLSSFSSSSSSNVTGACKLSSETFKGGYPAEIDEGNLIKDSDEHLLNNDNQLNAAKLDDGQLMKKSDSVPSYGDLSPFSVPIVHFLPRTTHYANASSYLRPGSRFFGTQQSGRTNYEVNVELKIIDIPRSFLSGYFKIEGLTENHPSLTTYFEAEIIGPHYSFFTKHKDWGANEKTDLSHWSRFHSFRMIQNKARSKSYTHPLDINNDSHIFMRWKEKYMVADPTINEIHGASFAGFYYISFDQVLGIITGLYFHSNSEKYQQLDLAHVPDHGRSYSVEFR